MPEKIDDLLPTAKEIQRQTAREAAEKEEQYARLQATVEAEKRKLIEKLSKPSGLTEDEKRTLYVMSATASPSVSILSSYNASGENGWAVVGPGGFTTADGCTFMIRIDLSASPGFGKAYKSVRSRRASPCGKPKSGPE